MSWNYRILEHENGWLALHEVYYDRKGQPDSWTEEPITFGCMADEGCNGIINSLAMALKDARTRPVLKIKDGELVEVGAACSARQYSDTTKCERCGLTWDTNDPEPPQCGAARGAQS